MYLISGASGAVGSALVRELVKQDSQVVALSREERHGSNCLWVKCDLANDIPDVVLNGAVVIHCAAEIRSPAWEDHWDGNVQATKNMLEWAVRNRVAKFVYISTGAVYGEQQGRCSVETDELYPRGNYAITKYLAEQLCYAYQMRFGVPVVTHRLYFPYGVDQPSGVIKFLSDAVAGGGEVRINRDGGPVISLTPIEDVVGAVLMSCDPEFPPGIYNLCGEQSLSIAQVVSALEGKLNKRAKVILGEDVSRDVVGSSAKLRSLGWNSMGSFAKYLDDFYMRYKSDQPF